MFTEAIRQKEDYSMRRKSKASDWSEQTLKSGKTEFGKKKLQ